MRRDKVVEGGVVSEVLDLGDCGSVKVRQDMWDFVSGS